MKICYIASPDIHTHRWVKYFVDSGHEVHIITSTKSSWDIDGISFHLLRRFGPKLRLINYLINSIPLVIQFKKLIRNVNPDIIHAHFIMDTTLLGAVSGFHPFIVTCWGSDVLIAPQKSKISRWIVKYVLKRVDVITCPGECITEPLTKLGADPQKIRLIHLGVDTRKFIPQKGDDTLRERLGLINSPVIISTRRFYPIYDVESLIRAIPLVLQSVPSAKFVIIGDGSQADELKKLSKSLVISEAVKFVGWVAHDEIPSYLTLADVYVSTSLSDLASISMMEAMACELPVVVTDSGDNVEWVRNGLNGFIIPIRNSDILAEKIIFLLNNNKLREEMGKANRQLVEKKASYEREMGKMTRLYEELVNKVS